MEEYVVFISPCALNMLDACAINYTKSLGYKIAVVVDDENIPGLKTDIMIPSDTSNANSVITDLVLFSNRYRIAAVLTYSDYHVEVTALVNQYFGLKGADYSAILKCKNKYLCREALVDTPWCQPRYMVIKNKNDILNSVRELGIPMVIKPINGMGSMYTMVINTADKAVETFSELQKAKAESLFGKENVVNDRWIIEQCLDGFQVSVESYTVNSETTIVCIHDKLNIIEPPLFRVYYSATPSDRISADLEREINECTREILKEIGFNNGIAHTEFRISQAGKIQLLEINARPGGGLIIPSAYYSTGVNLFTVAIDIALNREPQVPVNFTKDPVVFRVVYPDQEGVLTRFKTSELNNREASIKIMETYSKAGDVVGSAQRIAMILKKGESDENIEDLVRSIDDLVNSWCIEIEPTDETAPLPKHIRNTAHV